MNWEAKIKKALEDEGWRQIAQQMVEQGVNIIANVDKVELRRLRSLVTRYDKRIPESLQMNFHGDAMLFELTKRDKKELIKIATFIVELDDINITDVDSDDGLTVNKAPAKKKPTKKTATKKKTSKK